MANKLIKTILLVEDDRFVASLYQTKLIKQGYAVDLVDNGEACLKYLDDHKPDLVLLDIIIPKIDGFAVLQSIKSNSRTKKIPVILLTNLGQDEDMQKGKKLGACDYLVKTNFTPAELLKKIQEVLHS